MHAETKQKLQLNDLLSVTDWGRIAQVDENPMGCMSAYKVQRYVHCAMCALHPKTHNRFKMVPPIFSKLINSS